ncbi:B3 domain-containing protein LFL1 [Cocos nucifera]|uniref:B3 domain-containing protein LFL1 n=1 Tax=Cocos nucifera TaxID=13894 RepID=A0A8K0N2Q9_COCNU|nr:B3 domain-containing protein LFL1 [Cocos nucifera]
MVGTRGAARAANPSGREAEDAHAGAPDLRSAVGFQASRRRRTAARHRPQDAQTVAAPPPEPAPHPGARQAVEGLRFLLQKELSHSDASSLGRIVLPKREAEAYLPVLTARDGIEINMDDLETFQVIRAKKAVKEQPAASADDEIFDSIVPDIVVASARYSDLFYPFPDGMSLAHGISNTFGYGLNYAFAADFTMAFPEERMENHSVAE